MKVVNLVSQVFFLLITILFLIYFLTGYDSAFEADQIVTHIFQVTIIYLEIMVVIMILRHINGYSTSRMTTKNQQKLLRNLGTSFYKLIFL